MNCRSGILTIALGAVAMSALASGQEKPNIIFMMMDDMGMYDAGFLGRKYIETPNIDRLAAEGIFFSEAYANSSECSPTRASIITGLYTPRHGVYHVRNPGTLNPGDPRAKVDPAPNAVSIGDAWQFPRGLKVAGYVTGFYGKWHHQPSPKPSSAVWDEAVPTRGAPDTAEVDPKRAFSIVEGGINFMERHRGQPFFLYLGHHAPHWPFEYRPATYAKYEKKKKRVAKDRPDYGAMIEDADAAIGMLLDALDESGLSKETWLFFFSDNGGMVSFTSNGKFRSGKGRPFEGGIRVPMIVRRPDGRQAGTTCDVPVVSTDFAPTFLALAGAKAPPAVKLDGRDLRPLLNGVRALENRPIFWHMPTYNTFQVAPHSAVRLGGYKLIHWYEDGANEFYHLATDPGEKSNLADSNPEQCRRLKKVLDDWLQATHAPLPEPNPNYDPEAALKKE